MPAVPIISLVVAVGSAVYSGIQASQNASYNKAVADQAADAAEDKARYDENLHRERVRKLLSTQRALYGKSGVDIETGSPLLTELDTVGQGELDALAIRYGGDVESARARSAGRLAKMEGKSKATASYIQAGSSLLSGGYDAYKSYKAKP